MIFFQREREREKERERESGAFTDRKALHEMLHGVYKITGTVVIE